MDILTRCAGGQRTSVSSSRKSPVFCPTTRFMRSLLSLGIVGLLTLRFFVFFFVSPRQEAHTLSNGVALTPPMGWSIWNAHFASINVSVIEVAADALVSSGIVPV